VRPSGSGSKAWAIVVAFLAPGVPDREDGEDGEEKGVAAWANPSPKIMLHSNSRKNNPNGDRRPTRVRLLGDCEESGGVAAEPIDGLADGLAGLALWRRCLPDFLPDRWFNWDWWFWKGLI
jgi:hypothetical protein